MRNLETVMKSRSTAGALLFAWLGAGCAVESAEPVAEPVAEALWDQSSESSLTVLSEYRQGNRVVGFYRLEGGVLLMRQDAPIGAQPLVPPHAMKGHLPSEIMAALTQSSPAPALVDLERELQLQPIGQPDPSSPRSCERESPMKRESRTRRARSRPVFGSVTTTATAKPIGKHFEPAEHRPISLLSITSAIGPATGK